jgi:redox-sensitive bicupin YhaK (pirin superfamily)
MKRRAVLKLMLTAAGAVVGCGCCHEKASTVTEKGLSMKGLRKVDNSYKSTPTLEGAGVHLRRAFGSAAQAVLFDPFLLLDDFRSNDREHFIKGFPWHPHRGIETITYVLRGDVEHRDSIGNKGVIGAGDVQWMTAGGGVLHQEMPKGDEQERMEGFQLWANLPASHKMISPRYRDFSSDKIPEVTLDNGVLIKIICGKVGNIEGPARDIVIEPEYLDITVPANTVYDHPTVKGHTVFTYAFEGPENHTLTLYEDGDSVRLEAGAEAVRLLFISGKPLNEPIAWSGPIVMNTQEELALAFKEYQEGTFIKK